MTNVYDSDDARNLSPPLEAQRIDYVPRESPVPFISDKSESPKDKPGPTGRDCKRPHRRRRNPNSSLSAKQILMSLGADQPNLINDLVTGPFLSRMSSDSGDSEREEESKTEVKKNERETPTQKEGSTTVTRAAQDALELITGSPQTKVVKTESESQDMATAQIQNCVLPPVSRFDRPTCPKREDSAASPSWPGRSPVLPQITTDYPRPIATSPKLRPYRITPSQHLATQTLPALQSPPQSAAANSPETNLPSIKSTFPDELAETRVKDQNLHLNGASPFYLPTSSSSPPHSRSPLEPCARRPEQYIPPGPLSSNSPYVHISPANSKDLSSLSSTPSTVASQPSPFHISSRSERSFTLPLCEPSSQAGGDTPSTGYPTPTEPRQGDSNDPSFRSEQSTATAGAATGSFKCSYAGCTAAPFQTQYLLNSHANVHSHDRPYFCPVRGCSRSEGGKGFKRKNEMIRHGLVHDSPGYVCPFCHDQQHRYPRPDNLQRHVRVHHVDRNKDDPLLRRILSQRPDSLKRGRKRRS